MPMVVQGCLRFRYVALHKAHVSPFALASYRSGPSSFLPTDRKRQIICFTCSAGIARMNLFQNEPDASSIF